MAIDNVLKLVTREFVQNVNPRKDIIKKASQ